MTYGRCGYTDDFDDNGQLAMWRGQVASSIRGRRGQAFLRDLIEALDAMPVKQLIRNDLQRHDGVCAIGAVGIKRGVDLTPLDPADHQSLAKHFNIAYQLVQEVEYVNDEQSYIPENDTPEQRWRRVRDWAAEHLQDQTE